MNLNGSKTIGSGEPAYHISKQSFSEQLKAFKRGRPRIQLDSDVSTSTSESESPEFIMPQATESDLFQQLRARRTAFGKHKNKDRQAVKIHIDKCIKDNHKFRDWSSASRWLFIKEKRDEKLQDRKLRGNSTVGDLYPDFYDKETELRWCWDQYHIFLDGDDKTFEEMESDGDEETPEDADADTGMDVGCVRRTTPYRTRTYDGGYNEDSDEDDEEPMPIKNEPATDFDEDGDVIKREESSPAPVFARQTVVKPAIRRDGSLGHMSPRKPAIKPTLEVKEGVVVSRTFSMARLIAESNGIKYQPKQGHNVHRVWKYMDGRLTEWPPLFGTGCISSELVALRDNEGEAEHSGDAAVPGSERKRKRELHKGETPQVKKVRFDNAL